jgi:predicted nucleic acid-binding protein
MTLVDTSVWIDYLEGGNHWTTDRLDELIQKREVLAYTDLILLEIIQGIREQDERETIEQKLDPLICLEPKRPTIRLAASIHQGMRSKGIQIRSIIDSLIAALSIETGAKILHKDDRDFDFIAAHYPVITHTKDAANK